ncbi:tetratricopeptide repeat protein [Spirosoma panaciterrae]|uniref:tetratricopeptide repeat protein n=1 Tax=Spirosoma panaciterrae TaxID=496058 RepID=UPI0003734E2B|nr:hypothetical protein [Spirosoma panaciterrae]
MFCGRTFAQTITQDSVNYYSLKLKGQHTPLERAKLQTQLAWFLSEKGNSRQATQLTFTAIDVFKRYQAYQDLYQAYTNLAQIFQFGHSLTKSLQYGKTALDYAQLSRDSSLICRALQSYAMGLGENRQFKPSLVYFGQALQLATARRDTDNLIRIYLNTASILIEKGDNLQTIKTAQKGLQLAEKRSRPDPILRASAMIGAALIGLNRFEEADRYFKRAERLLPALGSLFYDREMALIRMRWAEKQHNYKAAYHYQQTYFSLDTSLANQASRQKVGELEVRYKTKENEQIKARLEQDLSYQRWLFVGGICVLALIVVVIYLQRKQLSNRNQLLEAREKMTTLQLQSATEQLTFIADSVVEKNAFIDQIKNELEQFRRKETEDSDELVEQLNRARMLTDAHWDEFRIKFEQLHPQFIDRLRQQVPSLTDTELKMACMIRLHFSAGQMAGMLGISAESIKKNRYRLRKKLGTEELPSYLSAV